MKNIVLGFVKTNAQRHSSYVFDDHYFTKGTEGRVFFFYGAKFSFYIYIYMKKLIKIEIAEKLKKFVIEKIIAC